VLRQLHWLPVRQRVLFKIVSFVYQSLPGHAPGYLVDDCQLVTDVRVRQLRSADTRTLSVNRTYSSFGVRTFAAAGTEVWNSLPPNLRQSGLSYIRPVQAVTEYILIRTLRPRRIVNSFNCAVLKYSYLLTYLHNAVSFCVVLCGGNRTPYFDFRATLSSSSSLSFIFLSQI